VKVTVRGVTLHYEESGRGEPVLLVPGMGARGRTWWLHQVPALVGAGYRAITLDNRGAGHSDPAPGGMTIDDLVADVAALIEHLCDGPSRLVGSSLGAHIVQELILARPGLARQAVLMASRGRPDAFSRALARAEKSRYDDAVDLPAAYDAVMRAMQNLSPHTLADEQKAQDWLDIFEMSAAGPDDGVRAQLDVDVHTDRLSAYAAIRVPTLVVAFADDMVAPTVRGRELAATIPGAEYAEIPAAGHYGFLEQPGRSTRPCCGSSPGHRDRPPDRAQPSLTATCQDGRMLVIPHGLRAAAALCALVVAAGCSSDDDPAPDGPMIEVTTMRGALLQAADVGPTWAAPAEAPSQDLLVSLCGGETAVPAVPAGATVVSSPLVDEGEKGADPDPDRPGVRRRGRRQGRARRAPDDR
jgi:pimeloyl-ACP methyl ester carboxylesterase